MKKTLLTLSAITTIVIASFAQNVNIPDANFKANLLDNTNINTDNDKLNISVAEAIAFNGTLDVTSNGIASLIGIEAFINLTGLAAGSNQLTSLDVTNNTALTVLYCYSNQLTSLDVTKNLNLTSLQCYSNTNLTCIQALDSQDKTAWVKDDLAQYNENCDYVTAINEEILTQPKTILAIYNLQGQQVNTSYQGLAIIRYTDGTSEKVIH
jgi:hypothetical protein